MTPGGSFKRTRTSGGRRKTRPSHKCGGPVGTNQEIYLRTDKAPRGFCGHPQSRFRFCGVDIVAAGIAAGPRRTRGDFYGRHVRGSLTGPRLVGAAHKLQGPHPIQIFPSVSAVIRLTMKYLPVLVYEKLHIRPSLVSWSGSGPLGNFPI